MEEQIKQLRTLFSQRGALDGLLHASALHASDRLLKD
jgi:hypothetical protein